MTTPAIAAASLQDVLGTLEPGEEHRAHVQRDPGTCRYDCSLHPEAIDGTVIVIDANNTGGSVSMLLREVRRLG